MTDFFKKIFKLSLSDEDQKVLTALNESTLTSRKVVGRGTLTVDVEEVTKSEKFKTYSKKASQIVSEQK